MELWLNNCSLAWGLLNLPSIWLCKIWTLQILHSQMLGFAIIVLAGVVIALTICSLQAGTPGISQGVFAYCGVWADWIHVGHLLP